MKYLFIVFLASYLGIINDLAAQIVLLPQISSVGLIPKQTVWNVLVTNSGSEAITVDLKVVVKERTSGVIYFDAFASNLSITPGVSLLNESNIGQISIIEIHHQISSIGFFPVGFYDFCYELVFFDAKIEPVKECIAVDVEAMAPPFLILPENGVVLPNQYPVFVWMPPAPVTIFPQLLYDILVVEQYTGQSANEAIQRNNPIVTAFNLPNPVFPLAGSGTQLDTGKNYVWQIIARNSDTYGTKSEAWSFSIANLDTTIGEWHDGAYYIQLSATGTPPSYPYSEELSFTIFNDSNDGEGNCKLISIGNSGRQILKSHHFTLKGGRNYIKWQPKLDISQHGVYLLKVELPSGKHYSCYIIKN